MNQTELKKLYKRYNRREYVCPDPLQFLYGYTNICDREIVGLIASSLAYGRVKQILKSVQIVLDKMTPSPRAFIEETSPSAMKKKFKDFKHRFTTCEDIVGLFVDIKSAIKRYDSLNNCFVSGYNDSDSTVVSALGNFVDNLTGKSETYLLPHPSKGSACKRLNLFLRWMVRSDDVDPGGWSGIPVSKLVVPLDTHMHKISHAIGLTRRKQADLKTALEITEAYAKVSPEDPVKYDFAITRLGIRTDTDLNAFIERFEKR